MTIQDSAVAGVTPVQRRKTQVLPFGTTRPNSPEDQPVPQGVYVGPWGAALAEHAGSRHPQALGPKTLGRVDRVALGLMYGATLALWPFAVCLLVGFF